MPRLLICLQEVDILRIWKLADRSNADSMAVCTNADGLPRLAKRVLSVAVSTGDTERVFSDFGITHTRRRNRLSPETVHKISVVRKALRRAHAAAGLLTTRMKRKLTSDGSEPSQSPTMVANGDQLALPPDSNADNIEDFEALGSELIKSAIDSRTHMEAETDEEGEDEVELGAGGQQGVVGGQTAQTSAPATPHLLSSEQLSTRSQPAESRRQKKGKKTTIRLRDLFLYPRPPPPGSSQSEVSAFEATVDGDRLSKLHFIWTTGQGKLQEELQLSETLQHSQEA